MRPRRSWSGWCGRTAGCWGEKTRPSGQTSATTVATSAIATTTTAASSGSSDSIPRRAAFIGSLETELERSAERPEDDPVTRTADLPIAARRADALVALVERALEGEANTAGVRDRHEVVLHVDALVLSDDADGRCELADGPALAPETVRRLACDASLVTVVDGPDGTPLDVGRKTRRIPPRLRRAVLARDGVCVFPGCDRPITEIHHRKHWANGGRTDLDTLDGHCKYDHRLLHEGGWSMQRHDDGRVVFRRPDGTVLETEPLRVEAVDGAIEAANSQRGLSISSDTCVPRCYGDALELDWTVAGLCQARERAAP
jgi:Domain of unknown function (DUF222)